MIGNGAPRFLQQKHIKKRRYLPVTWVSASSEPISKERENEALQRTYFFGGFLGERKASESSDAVCKVFGVGVLRPSPHWPTMLKFQLQLPAVFCHFIEAPEHPICYFTTDCNESVHTT